MIEKIKRWSLKIIKKLTKYFLLITKKLEKCFSKRILKIVLGIVVLILILLFIFRYDIWGNTTVLGSSDDNGEEKICFLNKTKITETEIETKEEKFDIRYLEINKEESGLISGIINNISSHETNSVTGSFTGVLKDNMINIIYNATAKEEKWVEQRVYLIDKKGIKSSDPQEKIKKDGIFSYVNFKELTFWNNNYIKKVDCESVNQEEITL